MNNLTFYKNVEPFIFEMKIIRHSYFISSIVYKCMAIKFNNDKFFSVGFLYEYIDRQVILITLLLIKALSTMLIPYSENIWHLYLFISLYGLGSGAWNSSNRVWVLEMWPKPAQSGAVLHLSGLMYGIGTILGPIIERPYLTGVQEFEFNINYMDILKTNSQNSSQLSLTSDIVSMRRYKLQKPFFIFGVIHMIGE